MRAATFAVPSVPVQCAAAQDWGATGCPPHRGLPTIARNRAGLERHLEFKWIH